MSKDKTSKSQYKVERIFLSKCSVKELVVKIIDSHMEEKGSIQYAK